MSQVETPEERKRAARSGGRSYVVGLAFGLNDQLLLMIRKARPAWQAGCLNGIGGGVEAGETPDEAIVREFREETGLWVRAWYLFLKLTTEAPPDGRPPNQIYFYRAHDVPIARAQSLTDEEVVTVPVDGLALAKTVPGMQWQIPLALSFVRGETCGRFEAVEFSKSNSHGSEE